MSFIITSEASKQYLLEEDAVKGFQMAVTNGQSRLALTILVDVINGMSEVFNIIMDDSEPESEHLLEEDKVEVKLEEVRPEEIKQEKSKPEPKVETKKESSKETKNS